MTLTSPGLTPAQMAALNWRFTPTGYGAKLGGLVHPRHVQVLGQALADLVFGDDFDRLLVFMPPRHAKSTTCSIWLPVWYLDCFPDRQVLLASYAHKLARKFGWAVRQEIRRHEDFLRVRLAPDFKARDQWFTTEGGGMSTAGMDGGFTGQPGHLVIVDDPYKGWKEAHSEVVRESVEDVYKSVLYTRKEPDTKVVVLLTRWHEDDLGGWLEGESASGEGDRFKVLRMPALCDDPANDPLGREADEALWPERHPVKSLERSRKVIGTYFFTGMFQQRPSPEEGAILKRAWWKWYRVMPDPLYWDELLQSWDMAFKDAETSSYVVGQLWGRIGGDKYLIDQVRGHWDLPETIRQLVGFTQKWREQGLDARLKLVEDKANGPAVIQVLQGKIPGLVAVTPKGSKESRVRAVSPDCEGGNVWLPDDAVDPDFPAMEFVDECAAFPNGTHDDQVDAFTQAILRMGVDTVYDSQSDYVDMRLAGRR